MLSGPFEIICPLGVVDTLTGNSYQSSFWWMVGWAVPQKKRRLFLAKEGKAGQKQLWWPPYCHWLAVGWSLLSLFPHLWNEGMSWAHLWDHPAQCSLPFVLLLVLVLFPPAKFCSSAACVKWKKTWLWAASVKEGLMEVSFTLSGKGRGVVYGETGRRGGFSGWEAGWEKSVRGLVLSHLFARSLFFFLRVNIFVRGTMLSQLYFLLN